VELAADLSEFTQSLKMPEGYSETLNRRRVYGLWCLTPLSTIF
jgi:hypothetical protein